MPDVIYTCVRGEQIASRWDAETEREVLGWFKLLINKDIPTGIHKVEKALRNGQDLVL